MHDDLLSMMQAYLRGDSGAYGKLLDAMEEAGADVSALRSPRVVLLVFRGQGAEWHWVQPKQEHYDLVRACHLKKYETQTEECAMLSCMLGGGTGTFRVFKQLGVELKQPPEGEYELALFYKA